MRLHFCARITTARTGTVLTNAFTSAAQSLRRPMPARFGFLRGRRLGSARVGPAALASHPAPATARHAATTAKHHPKQSHQTGNPDPVLPFHVINPPRRLVPFDNKQPASSTRPLPHPARAACRSGMSLARRTRSVPIRHERPQRPPLGSMPRDVRLGNPPPALSGCVDNGHPAEWCFLHDAAALVHGYVQPTVITSADSALVAPRLTDTGPKRHLFSSAGCRLGGCRQRSQERAR